MTDLAKLDAAATLRDEMLSTFKSVALYWANLPDFDNATGRALTVEGRCTGVVFSILAQLDGVGSLPAFDLVAHVHLEGEDQTFEGVTISDMLHEHQAKAKAVTLIDPTDDAAIARAGLVRLSALGYRGAG